MDVYLIIALTSLFAADIASSSTNSKFDCCVVSEYEKFCHELETNCLENISSAINYYQERENCMTQNEKDRCFILFREFYINAIISQNTYINNLREMFSLSPQKSNTSIFSIDDGSWSKYGMDVLNKEGYEYLAESNNFLLNKFHRYVSDSINDFLLLRSKEEAQIFQRDATIKISWKDLAIRCLNWESYLKKYADSLLLDDAKTLNSIYISALLTGTNNTRVFESEHKWLDQRKVNEISDVYIWVIENYPSCNLSQILKGYLPVLKESGFIESLLIHNFLQIYEIEPYCASRILDR